MIKNINISNETVTPNKHQISILKENFPSCFQEDGSFDIERFKEYLSEEVNITNEGYELKFLGKSYSRLLASLDTTTVIVPNMEHNSKPENINSNNIYISGDNLDGLKHILKSYSEQVKCVYIDPPYNTGTDGFIYNDNFNFSTEELSEKLSIDEGEAKRILDLTSRGSSSHSAWLMFMYPRLLLARDILSDEGTIFISIDDNEQSNLKLMCDDIFGPDNFVTQIIVQSNKRGQTYKQIAKTHEYVLVYTKKIDGKINELLKDVGSFKMSDDIGEFSERELRNRNPKFGRFNRPNLFYPIYVNTSVIDRNGYSPVSLVKDSDYTHEVYPFNSKGEESCWRWGTQKLEKNNNENTLLSNVIARKKNTGEFGIYEKYRKTTYKAKTIWFNEAITDDLIGEDDDIWDENGVISEQGSVELGRYEMSDAFDFPKPRHLVEKVLTLGSNSNDLCVDFFSGSATTADAVMNLNATLGDEGNRKFIAIQLPENLDNKLEMAPASDKPKIQKAIDFLDSVGRPHTLDQIGMERIVRAAERIKEEHSDVEVDLGFKHFTLEHPQNNTLDKIEEFDPEENKLFVDKTVLDDFGLPTVLTTWLVKDGYGFTSSIEKLKLSEYTSYYIKDHLYLIEPQLNEDAIKDLVIKYETDGTFNPQNVVLFGYSFNWTELEGLRTNLNRLKDTEKNLRINFDVRY